ncbi:hypothetical protein K1T34_32595 [Amycolatopsis sp. DSM 110486]|nr:hypothetical protein K1T34_32595 [Amycolatopsis sp. DSM 110486]
MPIPRGPTIDAARFAAAQHTLFSDSNLHVGRSGVVHAVGWVPWLDNLELPSPACHQGYSGTGAHGELLPTRFPVTCMKCRRARGLTYIDDDQQVLFIF